MIKRNSLIQTFLLVFAFCSVFFTGSLVFAGDSTVFDPRFISIAAKNGGVPVGTVIAWPVSTNPPDMDNWLECDGQAIPEGYPELYALIGPTVPNYQGMFLRGHGSQTSTHYGSVTHSSGGLNQVQGDAIRNIKGEARPMDYVTDVLNYTGPFQYSGHGGNRGFESDANGGKLIFDASRVVPTANEIRPVNKAVRYLIRAKS